MKLALSLPSTRWFVVHDDAWFRVVDPAVVDLLVSVLALESVDEYDLVEQPHQRGTVSATLDESAEPATVRFVFSESDGTELEPVDLPLDVRLLAHVEWLDQRFRDGWAPADLRLRLEGMDRMALRVYLPPVPGSSDKNLVIERLGDGQRTEVRLARDATTDIALVDGPFTGTRTFRLRCDPETISGSTDTRQLGFVVVDELVEAA